MATPTENLGLITTQIKPLLKAITGIVKDQVLKEIPLLGQVGLTPYIDKLITEEVENRLEQALKSAEGKGVEGVRQALYEVLGPNGLKILLDLGQNGITAEDIQTNTSSSEFIGFTFKLGKAISEKLILKEKIGPKSLELSLDGEITPEVTLGVTFDFGVDKDGVFVNFSGQNEIEGEVKTTFGKGLKLGGSLGFFKIAATDNGSIIGGTFKADIQTTASQRLRVADIASAAKIASPVTDVSAALNLKVETEITSLLPSLTTDFSVSGLKLGTSGTSLPEVKFDNVLLKYGSLAEGAFDELRKYYTKVIKQPLDIIQKPIPVIKSSLVDLAREFDKLSGGDITPFLDALKVIEQSDNIVRRLGTPIQLGNYKITGNGIEGKPTLSIEDQILGNQPLASSLKLSDANQILAASTEASTDKSDSFLKYFPILKSDPQNFIKLLRGEIPEGISLFHYQTPALKFNFSLSPEPTIPIFGPIVLKFGANAGAGAQIAFGYDTQGLIAYKNQGFNDAKLLANGLYLENPDGTTKLGGAGGDLDQIFKVFGEINVTAGASVGVAELVAGGGIFLTAGLGITPDSVPNQNASIKPRKYLGQLADPACAFEVSGKLGVVAFASASLNLGVFKLTKRFNLARINLIDYSSGNLCDGKNHYDTTPPLTPEIRNKLKDQNIIERDGTTGKDSIVLQASESKNNEDGKVKLTGLIADPINGNDYADVKLIIINAGDEDDQVELRGTVSSSQLYGEAGNDTLIGGAGIDFLDGGQGNDVLDGGTGANTDKGIGVNTAVYANDPKGINADLVRGFATDGYGNTDTLKNIQNIEGSQFDDVLIGDSNINFLDSGLGNDKLFGGGGNDVLLAGAGADEINGEDGTDTITYLDSSAPVYVNISGKDATVSSPIFGVTFPTLFKNSGLGGDAEGDRIFTVENLHGSSYDDVLVAGNGGGRVDGYRGSDLIYAGSGDDILDGGLNYILVNDQIKPGNDINWLSYQQSDAGVNVSFQTGAARGGYADGDQIMMAYNPSDITAARFNFSSFRNLEGSIKDDVLEGDLQNNILRGLSGDDTIFGQSGNDLLIGGEGKDSLYGGDNGVDPLRALSDSLEGGGDTAIYSEAKVGVTVDLVIGGSRGEADGDQFFNIENLLGSAYGDNLTGDAGNNDIDPGLSYGEIDTVDGGGGDIDRLTVNYSLNDYGTSGVVGGFSRLELNSGSLLRNDNTDPILRDQVNFTNIERLYIIGTSQNDQLFGGYYAEGDIFFTGTGDDTIDGGAGADQIYADDGNDIVSYQMIGSQFITDLVDRSDLIDSVIQIYGGNGIDMLSIDLSTKSNGILLESLDPIIESLNLAAGVEIREFEIFKNVKMGAGDDVLTQLGQIDNLFKTGGGDDIVNPGIGKDNVYGGLGDDILILNYSAGDIGGGIEIILDPTGNTGTAQRTIANSLIVLDSVTFSEFEIYQITGTSKSDLLIGGDKDDILQGGAGDDKILGNYGNDKLFGGDGDDILEATLPYYFNDNNERRSKLDIDILSGGLGADTFVLANAESQFYEQGRDKNYALITDFNPNEGDRLQLKADTSYKFINSPNGLPSGVAVYTVELTGGFNPTLSEDLIAVVQSVPGSAGLTTRSIGRWLDTELILGKTVENPFVWVGDPISSFGPK
jgi:Ca2+-binding RTX toxin-like protein